jgi:hypothetical protein
MGDAESAGTSAKMVHRQFRKEHRPIHLRLHGHLLLRIPRGVQVVAGMLAFYLKPALHQQTDPTLEDE